MTLNLLLSRHDNGYEMSIKDYLSRVLRDLLHDANVFWELPARGIPYIGMPNDPEMINKNFPVWEWQ